MHVDALLAFPDYLAPAERLAAALGCSLHPLDVHRFPDGESRLRLPARLSGTVAICRSLHDPNPKLIELALAARGARSLGAESALLVAPYLCYMRQDAAFAPGEVVSQTIIGGLLADWFDGVITVDPHLHRIERLEQAVPARHTAVVSAAPALSAFVASLDSPVLIGPDRESEQWVATIAKDCGCPFGVARKIRRGDADVQVALPELALHGRDVVLVDDIVSTGSTLAAAARAARNGGARAVHALVTHALFPGDAADRVRAAGVEHIWSTDSVPHPSNAVELAPLLAQAIGKL